MGVVAAGWPAATAGLEVGDVVKAINGEAISGWRDLVNIITAFPGEAVGIDILRNGADLSLTVIPEPVEAGGQTIGRVGIAPEAVSIPDSLRVEHRYSVPGAIVKGIDETWLMSILTLRMLGKMLVLQVSPRNISGPITIAQYAGETARIGLVTFMSFLAIISISLGVLNLLPIPMLDGGHLLYYALETVIGKPLSEKMMMAGQQLGMVLLFGLMCLAFYNDIFRLLG
jgi:regulator of sigma E protease